MIVPINFRIDRALIKQYAWILYVVIAFTVFILYFSVTTDKRAYYDYKDYETKTNAKQQVVIEEMNKAASDYASGAISKSKMVSTLEKGGSSMEDIYSHFKWSKGDEITKEMYLIKKQMLLIYVQHYKNKAKAIDKKVSYSDADGLSYIAQLQERYNQKDMQQKERYGAK